MRHTNRGKQRKRPGEQELEDTLERSTPSYTPEHRRAVLKGLRILARVAIRSYMEEEARHYQVEKDDEEERREGPDNDREQRRGV